MKHFRILIAASFLMLGGCASLGSVIEGAAVSATSSAPTQAKTVAEAAQAATLAEQAVDLYVKTGNPGPAVLRELQTLVTGIHNTLTAAQTANASGNSAGAAAGIAAFNEAFMAYETYATKQGVKQ